MGIFKSLFKTKTEDTKKFVPDETLTEYENWIKFLGFGGTTEEWNRLKKKMDWKFAYDATQNTLEYQEEIRDVSDNYNLLLNKIESNWSILYNKKDYSCHLAEVLEKDCLKSIDYYKDMFNIDKKYGKEPLKYIPAFRRLAMLYERQGNFEKSIGICKEACTYEMNETSRLLRMIKKAGRTPTQDEIDLINKFQKNDEKENQSIQKPKIVNDSHINRSTIPTDQIEEMQRIEASKAYRNKLYEMFYKDYPEMPFISKDRELNTEWIEQAQMFNVSPSRSMMVRYSDGLLPGHVYMLYWLSKYTNKRIPSYFEYKYGIEFNKEKLFLIKNGYLTDDKPTEKGEKAIKEHYKVLENHVSIMKDKT